MAEAAMTSRFNPHPTRRLGAIRYPGHRRVVRMVSILTQPEGWVPYGQRYCTGHATPSFNPHPTRRLGAINSQSTAAGPVRVSILTQPEGWVPSDLTRLFNFMTNVSILTQPEGWVPYPVRPSAPGMITGFNPHPTRRLGAMAGTPPSRHSTSSFQSSPNPKVGCHD